MFDLALRGGTVVTEDGMFRADLVVQGGRIAGLVAPGSNGISARQVLDVEGLYLLPGAIDVHVHFREPGLTHKEDWETGSAGAAVGGVTTVLEMPNTLPPTATVEALHEKVRLVEGRSYVDFGLYGVVMADNLDQIEPLARAGAVGFKIFLGETTGQLSAPSGLGLVQALRAIARTGLRVGFHAEDREICAQALEQARRLGLEGLAAHLAARPAAAELDAIGRLVALARHTGAKVHIFHLSAGEGVELIRFGRALGADITGETCPHYLLLSVDDPRVQAAGTLAKVNPPLRTRADAEKLWEGLRDGTLALVASDHAPHTAGEKTGSIWEAAAGMPGVELLLPLLLNEAGRGRCSLSDVVRWLAAGPARTFGLYPRKGTLSVGADADIAVVDLGHRWTIRAAALQSKARYTPFDGWEVSGAVVYTLVGGRVVAQEGRLTGPPAGRWVRPLPRS